MGYLPDEAKEFVHNATEIIKDRLFSPMYFYFIIAWIITNRKFVYVLLFVDQEHLKIQKLDYMLSLYSFSNFWGGLGIVSELFLYPLLAAFIAAWPLTRLGEFFFKRYEQHKNNQIVIKRLLDYEDKVKESKEQRVIRDLESDKKTIKYEDNKGFNDSLDEDSEMIIIAGIRFKPSEVLYNNDYDAYKDGVAHYLPF